MTVLIVDDSATMRKIIMRTLDQSEVEIECYKEAGDGVEGLVALEGGTFDLILIDVNMPNMHGLDLLSTIVEKCPQGPPVVMITSEGSDEIIAKAMKLGAKGYLKKPFTPDEFQTTLEPILG